MRDELEIVAADGARKLVVVAHKPHVIQDLSVRVVPLENSVRVEPLFGDDVLHLDGEDVVSKELLAGEFLVINNVRLRWLGSKPGRADAGTKSISKPISKSMGAQKKSAPKAKSAESYEPVSTSRHRPRGADEPRASQRMRRAPKKTNWLPASAITAALLVIAMFVVQRLSDSTWPHSPKHFVELAQAQYDNNDPQRALETLAFALRDATGETREQAEELEKDIRRMMLEQASALQVSDARYELDLIKSFVSRYLKSTERPAARECVRLCDIWLESFRSACDGHSRGQAVLTELESIRSRYISAAAPGSPETPADVIFAARSRLRFQWRDYKGAFAALDAFLARNAGDEAVTKERKKLLTEGDEWLQKQLRRLDRQLERGDLDNAEQDLGRMDKWVVIPEWQEVIDERRSRLQALLKTDG